MQSFDLKKYCLEKAISVYTEDHKKIIEAANSFMDYFYPLTQVSDEISENQSSEKEVTKEKNNPVFRSPEINFHTLPKQMTLTEKQIRVLDVIISLNKTKLNSSAAEISRRMNEIQANIAPIVKTLVKKGYVKVCISENNRRKYYIALKDRSMNALLVGLNKNEKGVTICPPAYASGFGFDKSNFEEIL